MLYPSWVETPSTAPVLSAPVPVVYVSEPVRWEYNQVTAERALDETELNRLGHEGWELAGILNQQAEVRFFFKRIVR